MPRFDAEYVPRSAMAIYAHPDDIEFTVAGTVAKWARAGCEVTFVLITSGNAGTHDRKFTRKSLARVREREERESARILGVARVVFLRHGDCELVPTLALRKELVRRIRRHRPEVVLCNDPQALFFGDRYINHPDHLAAGKAALEAVFPCAEMELLWPGAGLPPQGPRRLRQLDRRSRHLDRRDGDDRREDRGAVGAPEPAGGPGHRPPDSRVGDGRGASCPGAEGGREEGNAPAEARGGVPRHAAAARREIRPDAGVWVVGTESAAQQGGPA